MITRGVRNHNPFNVIKSSSRWLGLKPKHLWSDPVFCEFIDMDYGIRCGLILLRKYIQVYHLSDVRGIISRFAPSSENDTEVYIKFVEGCMCRDGFTPTYIEFGTDKFYSMCLAILRFESKFYTSPQYLDAVRKYFAL